jgi:uncharacterized membrane protein YagU involved in acid resistance
MSFSTGGARSLPWPFRSALAGLAGTAALSLTYRSEHRRRHATSPLDYDDSLVPGQIVGRVLGLPNVSDRDAAALGTALRWGYGSLFGVWHGILRRRYREPWASLVFGATLLSATLSLFPALGRTPPPWKWSADVFATSVGTHAVYVLTVAVVDGVLAAGDRPRST